MKRKFIVIDGDNNLAWSTKKDAPVTFASYLPARKRALELAESNPGTEVLICKAYATVTAPVAKPVVRAEK